jgi:hypothetical protein
LITPEAILCLFFIYAILWWLSFVAISVANQEKSKLQKKPKKKSESARHSCSIRNRSILPPSKLVSRDRKSLLQEDGYHSYRDHSISTSDPFVMKAAVLRLVAIAMFGSIAALIQPQIIHEFPLGTWLENLAPRTSYPPGVLVNMLSSPDIYLVPTHPPTTPIHIAHIPHHLGLMGITEMGHDVFFVIAGNFSVDTFHVELGSFSIWEVDLRGLPGLPGNLTAKTTKIADVPTGLLNGLTVLNPVEGTLLAADSENGVAWSISVRTGQIAVAVNDTSMAPLQSSTVPLGINGLHVVNQNLYYTNTNKASLSRIPLNMTTGEAIGLAETLVQSPQIYPDDFTVDFDGNVWLASDAYNQLVLLPNMTSNSVSESSNIQFISGSHQAKKFMGLSATAFGTGALDLQRGSLYVTTNGGMEEYKYKNWTMGGSLLRYDIASFLS